MFRPRSSRHPTPGSAREQAAYWWVCRDLRSLTPEEERDFAAWLSEPSHEEAYARAGEVWSLFSESNSSHLQAVRAASLARRRAPSIGVISIAASLVIALIASLFWLHYAPFVSQQPAWREVAERMPSYQTDKGEQLKVTLPDGSIATLNTDSVLSVAYTDRERVVRLLRGQALFEVMRSPSRPFVVNASGQRVVAVGTAFDVRLTDHGIKVVLIEGSVRVEGRTHRRALSGILLAPGQALIAGSDSAPRVIRADTEREVRWRDGFVEFDNEPLIAAVAEINRYTDKPVLVRDPAVASLRVSGIFRTGSPQHFADVVSEILPVASRHEDGHIELVSVR